MANRTTVKSNIVTKIQPMMVTAIHRDVLMNELADNVRFREDVAVIQNSASSAITVDFTGKDRVDLTRTGGSLAITISGMGDGEEKGLMITKTAGQVVSFVGVTDVTPVKQNADALASVLYIIKRVGSSFYAKAWVESPLYASESIPGVLHIASAAEGLALTNDTKAITPAKIPIASDTQRGLIRRATLAEAKAHDGSTALTPARFLELLNYEMSANIMNLTGRDGNITVVEYDARKVGRLIVGYFIARSAMDGAWQVGTLSGYIPVHGGNWSFCGAILTAGNEAGNGYVTQGGAIFIDINNPNDNYVFNFAIPVNELPI